MTSCEITHIAMFVVGLAATWFARRCGYKDGLAVSTMMYRAMQGEDPLPESEMDSIDEDEQETTV